MDRLKAGVVLMTTLSAAVWVAMVYAGTADDAVSDVRCLIVGMNMGKSSDASTQTAGLMSMYYYFGRLDARSPKPDLEQLIASQVVKMTAADLQAEGTRCGSQLSERGKALQLIGQHLAERGKQQELQKRSDKP